MKCTEKDCDGEIDRQLKVDEITGCGGCCSTIEGHAYACNRCGRLHWFDGWPVFNENGKAFFVNKEVVYKGK
jgi:hypothetical protein